MKELVEKISDLSIDMVAEMGKSLNGNKAAGVRARKLTLEIEKACKEYRKVSLGAAKK